MRTDATRSTATLTLSDVKEIWDRFRLLEAVEIVRAAKAVEIHATPYLKAGTLYVMDPSKMNWWFSFFREPVRVLCHEDDIEIAHEFVDRARATQHFDRTTEEANDE